MTVTKDYKRLIKFKQKHFTDNLFNELKSMHCKEPHAYMELVKALCDGKHDRSKTSDLQEIEPDTWFESFSSLFGRKVEKSNKNIFVENYISNNIDKYRVRQRGCSLTIAHALRLLSTKEGVGGGC